MSGLAGPGNTPENSVGLTDNQPGVDQTFTNTGGLVIGAATSTYPFTLTNNQPGDLCLDIGTIRRGQSIGVNWLTPSVRVAIAAGTITCTPNVSTPAVSLLIVNSVLASYASNTLLYPSTTAITAANDAALGAALIALQNQVASLQAFVDNNVFQNRGS